MSTVNELDATGLTEVYIAKCYDPGATVNYRGLTLTKCDWASEHANVWKIEKDGERLETINAGAYPGVRNLKTYLDFLAEYDLDADKPLYSEYKKYSDDSYDRSH